MKKIKLTQGKYALVDDEDFVWLNQYSWYVIHNSTNTFYAARGHKKGMMHREILKLTDPKIQVDHINGDGLDNRKKNLRRATRQQNQANRGRTKNNTSGYKGIYWHKLMKKWKANIGINNKKISLGYFDNKIDAAKSYDIAAIKYHGEFAKTNFPRENYCLIN